MRRQSRLDVSILETGESMGYMDISVCGSDCASDLNHEIRELLPDRPQIVQTLLDELCIDHGSWNTHGCVNVALALTEGAGDAIFYNHRTPEYIGLLSKTVTALEELRRVSAEADWDGNDEGKQEHVSRYDELLVLLKERIASQVTPEEPAVNIDAAEGQENQVDLGIAGAMCVTAAKQTIRQVVDIYGIGGLKASVTPTLTAAGVRMKIGKKKFLLSNGAIQAAMEKDGAQVRLSLETS